MSILTEEEKQEILSAYTDTEDNLNSVGCLLYSFLMTKDHGNLLADTEDVTKRMAKVISRPFFVNT